MEISGKNLCCLRAYFEKQEKRNEKKEQRIFGHVIVGKIKKPKLTKQHFHRPFFRKQRIYATSICNLQ